MDKVVKLFDKNKIAKAMKESIVNAIGAKAAESVWEDARNILIDILNRYSDLEPEVQQHTDFIFLNIAVYKALRHKQPDKALQIMEESGAVVRKKAAKFFQGMVRIPFGKAFFLKGFAAGCKSGFGPKAGFANTVYRATSTEYKMDITACPYAKYCNSEGCAELTHIFCDGDIYLYGELEGIRFIRTETLGTGGAKCDFWLVREK